MISLAEVDTTSDPGRETGALLVEAVAAALPSWLEYQLALRLDHSVIDDNRTEIDRQVGHIAEACVAELTELVMLPFENQRTSPLAVLRSVVAPLTDLLAALGAEPSERDQAAIDLHPSDVFDLTPGAFAEFGEDVGDAGLRWGAAKAFVHLRSRRP